MTIKETVRDNWPHRGTHDGVYIQLYHPNRRALDRALRWIDSNYPQAYICAGVAERGEASEVHAHSILGCYGCEPGIERELRVILGLPENEYSARLAAEGLTAGQEVRCRVLPSGALTVIA